eukprot:TRINITY_DN2116_c0_g1_i2.p1 TRINITY_DN2116_c0_g1~~TRINITY_DN2116_c0_g1_i2.p1  ORF type:complete len:261 (+),score=86.20 TRINITY_DN2116_c0_g1_i2:101-883(+)
MSSLRSEVVAFPPTVAVPVILTTPVAVITPIPPPLSVPLPVVSSLRVALSAPLQEAPSSPPGSPSEASDVVLSKRKRVDVDRKERHNTTERKGRQKINSEIAMLRELLPEIQSSTTPKASILQCAVDNLKRLQSLAYQLLNSNVQLKEENKRLWAEVNRLRSCMQPQDTFINDILEQKLLGEDPAADLGMGIYAATSAPGVFPQPVTSLPAPSASQVAQTPVYEVIEGPSSPPAQKSSQPAYYQMPSSFPTSGRGIWCFS